MRSRSLVLVRVGIGALLLVASGCGKPAEPAAKSGDQARAKPAEPEPPPEPEVDAVAPSEPMPEPNAAPPEPEPTPPPPEPTEPVAGNGFELGARPKSSKGALWAEVAEPLRHAGASVWVTPDVFEPVDDEGQFKLDIQVRIEFEGMDRKLGLNHVRTVADSWCDTLIADVQEVGKLDDDRWLVDAQLACRGGEDYFWANNAHTLIVVDPVGKTAELLWTGSDSASDSMGVCVSSSVSSFEIRDRQLIIRRTEVTELDRQAAKRLEAAAEGCEPKPETTEVAARIDLSRGE